MARPSLPLLVRDRLRKLIQDGPMLPGDQLPSEGELASQMGVGRSTVREALKLLEQEGVVDVQPGLGRFVSALTAHLIERPITHFQSITDLLREFGYEVTSQVLAMSEASASDEEAHSLGLVNGAAVIRLARVRLLAGVPIVFMEETLPRALMGASLTGIDWSGSVTEALAHRGHRPISSRARMRAAVLPGRFRRRLGSLGRRPWIEITETDLGSRGEPCLYAKNYLRGDLFAFNFVRRSEI